MRTAFVFCLVLGLHPLVAAPLVFDSMLKETHLAADSESVTIDFHFENKSDKQVVIRRYDAACNCMQVSIRDGKLTYGPGEKGTIRSVFDMKNFMGVVDKAVMLYLDDDPQDEPSIVLTTRIHIPVLVVVEPKTLQWSIGEQPVGKTVSITMHHTEPIRIRRVVGSTDGFLYKLRTVDEGKSYELALTPKDTGRPVLGIFRIETDCAIEKHRIQQVFGVIRK